MTTPDATSPRPIEPDESDPAQAQYIRSQRGRIPVGRPGTPCDIVTMCASLCSPDAGFTSGQMIAINGTPRT
jgi:NAD(P)-dependent dehydrogenase (short-subunit alcohol dehydrogenase family)